MDDSSRKAWVLRAILIGVVYAVVGVALGELPKLLPPTDMRIWRWGAWVISAAVYAGQILYEHFKLANKTLSTAIHVAAAVAVGGFGLAVAATIHELWTGPGYRRSLLLAFVAWPVLVGLPAFVVTLILAFGLKITRIGSNRRAEV